MTGRRESEPRLCSEGTDNGCRCVERHRPGRRRARRSTSTVVAGAARAAARGGHPHRRRGDRRGARLHRRAERLDGRQHRGRRADGAGRLPQAGRRQPGRPTPARRWARPWRAPTRWAAARRAAAGRWTRCSRPTGSARGWPGASWRGAAAEAGVEAATMAQFAELVFAYIDELSAASVAGHTDELSTSGRVRERYRERLGQHLLAGARATERARGRRRAGGLAGARHADRGAAARPPQVRGVARVPGSGHRCRSARTCPGADDRRRADRTRCCWCPTSRARGRRHLLRVLDGRHAVVGPARPVDPGPRLLRPRRADPRRWSTARPRAAARWTPRSTSPTWSSRADPEALADLRARVLAPLADLRPATRRAARGDAALLAAAPGPPRRGGRRPARARADGALPDGPAARAVRRPARRPARRCWTSWSRCRTALPPRRAREPGPGPHADGEVLESPVSTPGAWRRRGLGRRRRWTSVRRCSSEAASWAVTSWRSTGPPRRSGRSSTWPRSLQSVVRLVLTSRFSMWMAWGPDLTFFCNEAYRRDTLGKKYPWALGKPASVVWSEIWDDIGPAHRDGAHRRARPPGTSRCCCSWSAAATRGDLPHLLLQPDVRRPRRGRGDAVRGQGGHRGGHRAPPDADAARPGRPPHLQPHRGRRPSRTACRELAESPADLPFTLVYLFDEDGTTARLAGSTGFGLDRTTTRRRRRLIQIDGPADGQVWPAPSAGRRDRRSSTTWRSASPACRPARGTCRPRQALVVPLDASDRRAAPTASRSSGSTGTVPSTTATATSATWSPASSRRASPTRGPTSSSAAGPRRWPSSTRPRPTSSPTSATSSAPR